jgi:ATP/maltotriose-dependent transcriptional regulator MalT
MQPVVALEGFSLWASKLMVPVPRPGTVERTRVLAALARTSGRPVVLMSAPAGYGKSIVASQSRAPAAGKGA